MVKNYIKGKVLFFGKKIYFCILDLLNTFIPDIKLIVLYVYNKISQKAYCKKTMCIVDIVLGKKKIGIHGLHNLQPFLTLLDLLNTFIPDIKLIVLYMYNKISQKAYCT